MSVQKAFTARFNTLSQAEAWVPGKAGALGLAGHCAKGRQAEPSKQILIDILMPQTCNKLSACFQVHKIFLDIARTEGKQSQDRKKALINKLLVAAGQNEAGYIMRCLQVQTGTALLLHQSQSSAGSLCDVDSGISCTGDKLELHK